MKRRVVSLCLILCMALSVFALASCGQSGGAEATATESGAASTTTPSATAGTTKAAQTDGTATGTATETAIETTAETTADKWDDLAPKVTMIAERDRKLKIEYSVKKSAEKGSKNDIYVAGPDTVEDGVTPLIQQMVYERNRAACEKLATTIEYVEWNFTYGEQAPQIDLVVKGNDADAPDLFINMIYDLNNELVNSTFRDVWSIPNSFFDFSEEGWFSAWMENMSFTGDRAYILASDYFIDVLRAMALLPFNMTMMDENAAKLAPAVLGDDETIGAGEALTTYFFDLVEEGDWTWEVLGKLCEAIWEDADNSGGDSIGDRLGIIADEYGGINAAGFIYSCGEQLTLAYTIEDESSAYNGKQWIKYADTSAGLNSIFNAVKGVFEGPGSLSTSYTFSGNTPEKPGSAYHHTKFASSELLFGGVCLLGTLEDVTFQTMTDLFSVVPCPKTDVLNDYNTIIVNQGDAGAMNVNSNPRKARVLSAFLQYCTEHSSEIREMVLQTVTKYKTTTYNQGTDRMLDIIYDGVIYGRDKTVDDLVGGDRWHSVMKGQHFVAGSDYIVSQYESLRQSKQAQLDNYMKKWYTLPKVEPAKAE